MIYDDSAHASRELQSQIYMEIGRTSAGVLPEYYSAFIKLKDLFDFPKGCVN